MSAGEFRSTFVRRFDRIWAQARQVQLSQAVCWAILTVLAGLSLLAIADYWLELPLAVRRVAVLVIGLCAASVAAALFMRSFRRWRRQATAATIEHVFPQLGQRIRTTVECAERTHAELQGAGLVPSLVAALDADTVRVAQPLPLDAVVPWKSLALASLSATAVALAVAGACAVSWQWRAAAARALLGRQPYTRIIVEPGDATVHEGDSLSVNVKVRGRTGSHLLFQSRRTDDGDSPWQDENIAIDKGSAAESREAMLEVPLNRIRHPLEYRVSAGSATSPVYRVDVLHPLKIVRQEATIQPPPYTRLPATTTEGGDVTALVGSHLRLKIELDRPPQMAWIETQQLARRFAGEEPTTVRVPLNIDASTLTTEFDLTSDQTYSVVAKAADGMELAANRFRLRARPDEPPQVWFDSPADAIEVHTLAEILMRIRASDDFGLSRAGIMFEVNNEEEYPLLAKDFEQAAEELRTEGQLTPQTRSTLEKVLPLEHFKLSQQDSVMYYAFAEDTRPGQAQRTETDLKFIDIRPFRRNYRPFDPPPGMGQGPRFKSLEEIISRQRYALNRTIQLDRKHQHTHQPDLPATDALIKFEGELAQATRDFAEGLLQRGIDETELLFQAETSMLAAADSLTGGNFGTATLQMREALKYLIEGRNRLEILVRKQRDRRALAELRQFDRLQQQKLRRPKSEEEQARQIAQRLEELANAEDSLFGGDMPANTEELEDRQQDIAAEARTLETALGKLAKATDLAKERMATAAKQAEDVAATIGRGEMGSAKTGASLARDQFRELSQQLKALLAQEQVERLATAQQMAGSLAQQQEQLENQLPGQGEQESQSDEAMKGLGGRARDLAEKAKTLGDVLGAAAKADAPADEKSAEEVARLVKALDLKGLFDRLGQLPAQLEQRKFAEARATLSDGQERTESAAQQLAVLRRSLVTPKVEELAQLEGRVLQLDKQLDQLDTEPRITQWHMETGELLDKLDEAINKELPTELRQEMQKSGWVGDAPGMRWNWAPTAGGGFAPPARYRMILSRLADELRGRMQEYLLGDTQATGDEPIPPQYQELVDRYYRVLAAEGKRQQASSSAAPPTPAPTNTKE
jgi:hypothetical protein